MSMLLILVPLSLLLLGVAAWAFMWAVGSGQFDDLETPAWDMLTEAQPVAVLPPVTHSDAADELAVRFCDQPPAPLPDQSFAESPRPTP